MDTRNEKNVTEWIGIKLTYEISVCNFDDDDDDDDADAADDADVRDKAKKIRKQEGQQEAKRMKRKASSSSQAIAEGRSPCSLLRLIPFILFSSCVSHHK